MPQDRASHVVVLMGYYVAEIPGGQKLFRADGTEILQQYGDWDKVMWGVPGQKLGRLPMALYLADQLKAERIIFAIGNARVADGMTEARWMMEYALQSQTALVRDFGDRFDRNSGMRNPAYFKLRLRSVVTLEDSGFNTETAMAGVADIIANRQHLRNSCVVHFVSSANHASRVLANALAGFEKYDFGDRKVVVSCTAAETCYGDTGVQDVKVRDRGDVPHKHWVKPKEG